MLAKIIKTKYSGEYTCIKDMGNYYFFTGSGQFCARTSREVINAELFDFDEVVLHVDYTSYISTSLIESTIVKWEGRDNYRPKFDFIQHGGSCVEELSGRPHIVVE